MAHRRNLPRSRRLASPVVVSMMIFHSDCNEIGIGIDKDAVTIAIDDRSYVINMTVKDRVDLGIQLVKSANIRHLDEKPPEIEETETSE